MKTSWAGHTSVQLMISQTKKLAEVVMSNSSHTLKGGDFLLRPLNKVSAASAFVVLVLILSITFLLGCVDYHVDNVTDTRTMIRDIQADSTVYKGKSVMIIGEYMGWDIHGDVGTGPPVTRSDWVIKDETGAIYVTGIWTGFDKEIGRKLSVTGTVKIAEGGFPYIEATHVEAIDTKVR